MLLLDIRNCLHFLMPESEASIFVIRGFIMAIGHSLTSSISAATLPSTSMSLIASLHDVIAARVKGTCQGRRERSVSVLWHGTAPDRKAEHATAVDQWRSTLLLAD